MSICRNFGGHPKRSVSALASHSRDQLRQAYADAWRKQRLGTPLSPLETMLADVIGLHPEYQPLLSDAGAALGFEPDAALVTENPFLHLGLHTAVREQLAIDRPPGVCELERQLQAKYQDAHRAEHVLMESLAETLWEAQRTGRPPDETHYLSLARSRLLSGN